eukprot:Skav228054  [mRNA]  locus=scaffold1188:261531:273422:+ [translate_table: standard]
MAPRSVGTLLFCVIEIANANCFEDAIPVVSRSNITVDGLSMPIGTWELQWDSASIVTRIFEILSSEKLGFHVANLGGHSSSTPVVYKLGGCLTWTPEDIGRDCVHPRRFHFAFESWQGASTFIPPLLAELGDRAPVNLGTLGYAGSSGMYVLGGAVEAALADSGLSLRYYANYNADWFQPSKYTATVADVNMSRLGTCDDGVSKTYRFFAPEYLEATGDTEGIYVDESGIKFKCWKEKWWLPPACRDLPANCSTLITHWPGWGMGLLTQWVSFHNMPIAIGIAVERIGNAQDEYAVFEEIGIVCPLHTSSQDELELRASRVTWRLLDSPPRPIAVKVESNDVGSVYDTGQQRRLGAELSELCDWSEDEVHSVDAVLLWTEMAMVKH